jgi:hypothetical protein
LRGSGVEVKERLRKKNEGKDKKNDKRLEEEVERGGGEGRGISFFAKIARSGDQFRIYLPKTFNPTWEKLWKGKKRVKVAVEV